MGDVQQDGIAGGRTSRWLGLGAAILCCSLGSLADISAIEESPRVAAVRFALQNGLQRPEGKLVVGFETSFGYPHPLPSKLTGSQQRQEAEAIAQVFGAGTLTGSAGDYLSCPDFLCSCKSDVSVALVGEVSNRNGVYVRVFSPPPPDRPDVRARLGHVIVDVERRGTAWFATGSARPPLNVLIRR